MKQRIVLALILLVAGCTGIWACTNFIVGKDASVDGSVMVTYAQDSYSHYGILEFTPAMDHEPGAVREVREGDTWRPLRTIPQVPHTYSVVGYMNEHQLIIGETTWGGRHELLDTIIDGIDYVSLMQIALERCRTAREAIECMTALVEEYGYASDGESFSIADTQEVWLMDMIGKGPGKKGAVWVATRIPDDCISAHANQARTTTLPVKAPKRKTKLGYQTKDGTVMWHRDVITFAREKGYFAGKDEEFNFTKAYNPYDFSGLYVCEARVWSFFRHFSNDMDRYYDYATGRTFLATKRQDAGEPMPLYFRPNRKVSAQDLKDCMRDQYEGTPLDITKGPGAGIWNTKLRYGGLTYTLDSTKYWYARPTATQQTACSFVAQARPGREGIFWFGVDDAASSCYIPMFCGITEIPEAVREGNGSMVDYSSTAAYWIFTKVSQLVYTRYSDMIKHVNEQQHKYEFGAVKNIREMENDMVKLFKDDPAKAQKRINDISNRCTQEVCNAWNHLFEYLLVKYNDGNVKKEKNGKFAKTDTKVPQCEFPEQPRYPDKWYKIIVDDCGKNIQEK